MCATDNFTCIHCEKTLPWDECLEEETAVRKGFEHTDTICYDCAASHILQQFDCRVPFTATKEKYESSKASIIADLKADREEDFSLQAEDPYDDRDRIHDWE